MRPTRFAERELELVNPRYFPRYNETTNRWEVRKWNSLWRKRNPELNSILICNVRIEDDLGRDIGYKDIDKSIIDTVREGFYWARKAKELSAKIDRDNERLEQSSDEEIEYVSRYMAKNIWHKFQEPTVFYGG